MKIEITDTSVRVLEQQWLYDENNNPVQAKNHSTAKGRGDYATDEEFIAAREALVQDRLGVSITQAITATEISHAELARLDGELKAEKKERDKVKKERDTKISEVAALTASVAAKNQELADKDTVIAALQADAILMQATIDELTAELSALSPAPTV